MNLRAHYLIQILDKIGVPLLDATERAGKNDDDTQTAQTVASLLGKVVETSISMNQALDLDAASAQDDSLRVAMAALAGSVVADQFAQKGKVPEAGDLNKIQSALSAVLTFADNFTLSEAHVDRLSKIKADGGVVDAHQINLQYIDALIPVINAVAAFPFGQPEQKLIMDVSDRLVRRSAEMRETLMPELSGDDEKLTELSILRASASVYAACHDAETKRLMGSDADTPERFSIDPVWDAFDKRTAMLEAVVRNMLPSSSANPAPAVDVAAPAAIATTAAAAPPVAPVAPAQDAPAQENTPQKPAIFGGGNTDAPVETPAAPPAAETPVAPVTPPPAAPEPEAPPPATEAPASANTGGTNPMGFFAKPKDGDSAPPSEDNSVAPPLAQAETPPATPPSPATDAPPLPPQEPAAPAPVEPPPAPPTEATPSEEGSTDSSDGGDEKGGNPMSFFSKKD